MLEKQEVTPRAVREDNGYRLEGTGTIVAVANGDLAHLEARGFAAATVRGYAYDLVNFGRFLDEHGLELAEVALTDLFEWLSWQNDHDERQARWCVWARGAVPRQQRSTVVLRRCAVYSS